MFDWTVEPSKGKRMIQGGQNEEASDFGKYSHIDYL